jgi:porin
VGVAVVLGALPCGAAPADEPASFLDRPQLLGDPLGVRSSLDGAGLTMQLFYNQVLAWKPTGGADDGSDAGPSGSYDFFAYANGERLLGVRGLVGLLHVKGQYEDSINEETGALSQPIDDADFDEGIYVSELWLQQGLFDNRIRIRAGFLEQQTTFDRNAYANSEDRNFLSTFLDNDGVVPLPNGFGANVILAPWPWAELAVGIADADNQPTKWNADDAFDSFDALTSHFELTLRFAGVGPLGAGSYRLGAFRDGRDLVLLDRISATPPRPPFHRRGHWGFYGSFDQVLYTDPDDAERLLGAFARVGWVDEDASAIEWFWSTGFEARGPIPGRREDVLGVAVYQAIASNAFQRARGNAFDEETGFEAYYRVAVLPWLAVTPDFQYVVNPGPSGTYGDALILALRLRVAF